MADVSMGVASDTIKKPSPLASDISSSTLDGASGSIVSNNDNKEGRELSTMELFTVLPECHVETRSGGVSKPPRREGTIVY